MKLKNIYKDEMSEMKYIGKYITEEVIAKGGTGTIYKARINGEKNGLIYAIKEVPQQFKTLVGKEKEISTRIERESKKSLVIPVLETIREKVSTDDGEKEIVYAITQFRKNGSFLKDIIRKIRIKNEGIIPIEHAIGLTKTVLEALDDLHNCLEDSENERGYVHLDVHPGNIFFENIDLDENDYGRAKFIDLQTAHIIDKIGRCMFDDSDYCLGVTPGFSSPEIQECAISNISVQSDAYSAIKMFAYMLIGEEIDDMNFYDDEMTEVMDTALSKVRIAPILEEFILDFFECGLAYKPEYRFTDIQEIIDVLGNIERANELYWKNDYFELFGLLHEMNIDSSSVKTAYFVANKNNEHGINFEKFEKAVRYLKYTLLTDDIDVRKSAYIYDTLRKLTEIENTEFEIDIYAELLSSGLAAYNRLGEAKTSIVIFEELKEIQKFILVPEWTGIVNRAAVTYEDCFQRKKASEILEKNISDLQLLKKTYSIITNGEYDENDKTIKLPNLARAYSAYGSHLAYDHDERAMDYFELALEEFGRDKGNKAITISHILHYAIEIRDEELFDRYYLIFRNTELIKDKVLNDFIDNNGAGSWYDIWVYLKAVYVFERQDKIKGLKEQILRLLELENFYAKNQHPQALIMKYCGLLLNRIAGDDEIVSLKIDTIFYAAIKRLEQGTCKEYGELNYNKIAAYHIESTHLIMKGKFELAAQLYDLFIKRVEAERIEDLKVELLEYNSGKNVPEIALRYEYC